MSHPAQRFVIISGCSGGGKSTLLCELQRRGYPAVEEPGRRIIAEEQQKGFSAALPWVDPERFALRAIEMALNDRRRAASSDDGWVFFDRGLIDAAAALEHATGRPILPTYAGERYYETVFVAPPWPEIYFVDHWRRHDIEEAIFEYDRLLTAFNRMGYETRLLPKVGVTQRADFILGILQRD